MKVLSDFEKKSIDQLIEEWENNFVEFKSSLRWKEDSKTPNKNLEFRVMKSISAFLNTNGGILIIGVTKKKEIVGVEKDYINLNEQNWDGYLDFLIERIQIFLEPGLSKYFLIKPVNLENKVLCKIIIKNRAAKPIFCLNEDKTSYIFSIRDLGITKILDAKQANNHIWENWESDY